MLQKIVLIQKESTVNKSILHIMTISNYYTSNAFKDAKIDLKKLILIYTELHITEIT